MQQANERAINWFANRRGKVTYSMVHRYGPSSYDCSSAVYYALIEAGILPPNTRIGNTETLFVDLERAGYKQLPLDNQGNAATQRGDIFIWGRRGYTLGAAGHTGMFVSADDIIHCNYGRNGITVDNHDALWAYNGQPAYTFYRKTGDIKPPAPAERKAIGGIHTVSERSVQHGIEQVLSASLYGSHPDWGDNGIPVNAINKVDNDGNWVAGKTMPGEKFVIPGLFIVSRRERDERNGQEYALLQNVGGYDVWVRSSVLTDKETPRPNPKPPVPTQPVLPEQQPVEPTPTPEQPKQPEPKQEYIEERVSKLEAVVNKIVEFLTSLFKGFKK